MPRKITVATVSLPPGQGSPEANRRRALELLDAAGAQHPDLVCLPEAVLNTGLGWDNWKDGAEPVPGRFSEALAERARRYDTVVVAGMHARAESRFYNVALVIDRQGRLIGAYRKIHLTISEMEAGLQPGSQPFVVETDFGRLGVAICYDIGWPAQWQAMANQGAELVVWSAAYDGGFPLRSYAWTHLYYVVSSVRGDHSKIIDITGRELASTSRYSRLTTARIDLEKEVFEIDYHVEKLLQVQTEMGDRVTAQGFSEEDIFTLESNDSDWPLARVKARFGLENLRDYLARATRAQDAARGH
jgi:beta-ureidopropionase